MLIQAPNLYLPAPLFSLVTTSFLCLWVYFCFVYKFLCIFSFPAIVYSLWHLSSPTKESIRPPAVEELQNPNHQERYRHLNAEFQRIARREKKAFFSDQCKETEEKNRTEWERLEISSRKLEIPREYFMQRWARKGQKWYGPNRSRRY